MPMKRAWSFDFSNLHKSACIKELRVHSTIRNKFYTDEIKHYCLVQNKKRPTFVIEKLSEVTKVLYQMLSR